jgi:hypothetical protein
MAYVLVMGGLALSVSFTLGWALWRSLRWLLRQVAGPPARGRVTPRSRKAPAPRKAAAARKPAARKASSKPAAKLPREPWGLTRWLSRRRSALPLCSLALLLYGLTRVVEFGMTQRPLSPPAGYHSLVNGLGWAAAVLLAMALLNLLARWRCRPDA